MRSADYYTIYLQVIMRLCFILHGLIVSMKCALYLIYLDIFTNIITSMNIVA